MRTKAAAAAISSDGSNRSTESTYSSNNKTTTTNTASQQRSNHNNSSGKCGVDSRCRLAHFLAAEVIELKAVKTQLPFRFSRATFLAKLVAPMRVGFGTGRLLAFRAGGWRAADAVTIRRPRGQDVCSMAVGSSMGISCGHQVHRLTCESGSTGVPQAHSCN